MPRSATSKISTPSFKAETEIAVLQTEFKNLDEKVDDLKIGMRELRESVTSSAESTHTMIKEFQIENVKSHKEMAKKISALEKWRWSLMGAGVVLGAIGWPVLATLFGM